MSLGGNLSSGYTANLIDKKSCCDLTKSTTIAHSETCCRPGNSKQPVARYPSMVLEGKTCPGLTPAQIFQLPKVATPSSARTQALMSNYYGTPSSPPVATLPLPQDRFSKYNRFQPPAICPPVLQPSAYLAGKSLPSFSRPCNF